VSISSNSLNMTSYIKSVSGGSTETIFYEVGVNTGSSATVTTDANGNMTSDGTNSYAWDAENRLIKETYPGTNNYTTYTYDGLGHRAKIVETVAGTVTSTKQFVYCGDTTCEARDASSVITAKYYPLGQTISATNYFYTLDHLGSVRELTNTAGAVLAQYAYNSYGQATKLQGSLDSDFQYAGYYYHAPSGMNLTLNRAYNASFGRWINRDPIGEAGGVNLFAYLDNNPISGTDPLGFGPCPLKAQKGKMGALQARASKSDPPRSINGTPSTPPGIPPENPPILVPTMVDLPSIGNPPGFGGAMPIPPGVNVPLNVAIAALIGAGVLPGMKYAWFYLMVRNRGPWDYKQLDPKYQAFGNYNYGSTAASAGIPLEIALRAAGYAQEQTPKNWDPSWGHWYQGPPYGDDPGDQTWIMRGYYGMGY
jgi:RHS repeat-associated protein